MIKKTMVMIMHVCDMIKRNESDVGDIVFEILVKIMFQCVFYIDFNSVKPDIKC